MLLGCIGDDFTGSADLANTLAKQGMRTVQYTGVPITDANSDVEAGIVALKTRSIPVNDAIAQSLEALKWLQTQGCTQFFFKYCSTFDSTSDGNIGPVIDALASVLETDCIIVCPAFPAAGRTVYNGHLFVNDTLLNESGMQNHPLTPMTDPDIRRCLIPQTNNKISHIPALTVFQGADSTKSALTSLCRTERSLVVVDAIRDEDLMIIAKAASELSLITGGSGIALGLPENFRKQGLIGDFSNTFQGEKGPCVILSGSCSRATRKQITIFSKENPSLEIKVADVISGTLNSDKVCAWINEQQKTPLVYSSADPEEVKLIQEKYGKNESAQAIENLFSEVAKQIVKEGFNRLIVAGGETSGAIIESLSIDIMEIGPEIDPGVPVMRASENLVIALKSGNFGAEDFFVKAIQTLETDSI